MVTGPGRVEVFPEPRPGAGPDQVLVQMAACGVCTLERRIYAGEKRWYPVSPGHEISGRVVEVGSRVNGLEGSPQVGEWVTVDLLPRCLTCGPCRRGRTALCLYDQGRVLSSGVASLGGFVELVAVAARHVYPVGGASPLVAAMGEPLACCLHSMRRAGFAGGDRVAIIGGGFMGRLHMALCRLRGAAQVGVVDVARDRRRDAALAGADWTASPEDASALPRSQDVVFVTAMGGLDLALTMVAPGGAVALYSSFDPTARVMVEADRAHREEITVVGVYSQEPADWREAAAVIRSGAISSDLEALITARFPLTEVGDALDLVVSQPTYRVFVEGRSLG